MTQQSSNDSRWDLFLQLLLGMADSVDDPIPMTLNVGGLIISGDLISEAKFREEFMGGHLWKRVVEVVNENETLKSELQSAPAESADTKQHEFIHLRNARYFFGGQNPVPLNDGALWRGYVDSVDGYFFGKLDTHAPE